MCKIEPCLVIDEFTYKKNDHIFFLTHWHSGHFFLQSDHYGGISNNWTYGPIYCSELTRRFLLLKYPKLEDQVFALAMNQWHRIEGPNNYSFEVKLFDSNHMAGSVMILLKFENSSYHLHTGDMRFNYAMLDNLNQLFKKNQNAYMGLYDIHTVYLDNTYCDPIFQFPNRALILLKKIINLERNRTNRVYLLTDTIGKEEAFVALHKEYKTKIVLNEERYEYAKQIFEEKTERIFTKERKKGWIEVIKRKEKDLVLKHEPKAILISLTGWANIRDFQKVSDNQYIVPYSLHSNYEELQLFISVIKPKVIIPIVKQNQESEKFRINIHSFSSYFYSLYHMKQRGLEFFIKHYTK